MWDEKYGADVPARLEQTLRAAYERHGAPATDLSAPELVRWAATLSDAELEAIPGVGPVSREWIRSNPSGGLGQWNAGLTSGRPTGTHQTRFNVLLYIGLAAVAVWFVVASLPLTERKLGTLVVLVGIGAVIFALAMRDSGRWK